jgi:hypothetical protein
MTVGPLSISDSANIRKELQRILGVRLRIHPKVKYFGIGQCWYIGQDWSIYHQIKGKQAHRVVYELCHGSIDSNLFVCHRCDRKGCVRPDHLFQGTAVDNLNDTRNKGRTNYGLKPDNPKRVIRFGGELICLSE